MHVLGEKQMARLLTISIFGERQSSLRRQTDGLNLQRGFTVDVIIQMFGGCAAHADRKSRGGAVRCRRRITAQK